MSRKKKVMFLISYLVLNFVANKEREDQASPNSTTEKCNVNMAIRLLAQAQYIDKAILPLCITYQLLSFKNIHHIPQLKVFVINFACQKFQLKR